MADEPLISLRGVRREHPAGEGVVAVLADVDLDVRAGEFVAIVGPSGSGKSTLMNIPGCLDRPTAGVYRIAGRATADLGPDDLAELRREHFGLVFQHHHLLSELSALGNTEIPAIHAGVASEPRRERAAELLTRLGLSDRLGHRPGQSSGGQRQRVSIARAPMNGADVVLADVPTGALDRRSGDEVLKILTELGAEGHTVILVTHDRQVVRRARRIVEISDGRIGADRPNETEAAAAVETSARRSVGSAAMPRGVGTVRAALAGFEESFHRRCRRCRCTGCAPF
jgi:macrolide transport system ATP-binding/permease protein